MIDKEELKSALEEIIHHNKEDIKAYNEATAMPTVVRDHFVGFAHGAINACQYIASIFNLKIKGEVKEEVT